MSGDPPFEDRLLRALDSLITSLSRQTEVARETDRLVRQLLLPSDSTGAPLPPRLSSLSGGRLRSVAASEPSAVRDQRSPNRDGPAVFAAWHWGEDWSITAGNGQSHEGKNKRKSAKVEEKKNTRKGTEDLQLSPEEPDSPSSVQEERNVAGEAPGVRPVMPAASRQTAVTVSDDSESDLQFDA
jgi:hypothetical protein